MKRLLTALLGTVICCLAVWTSPSQIFAAVSYVGSKACAECHAQQYESFSNHSKKAKSARSVKIMASKLTDAEIRECYGCHTTGFGQGGFESFEKTPHLADVGCETCHGPGSAHASSGDPSEIAKPKDVAACTNCHDSKRVKAFNYKPLIRSGAH